MNSPFQCMQCIAALQDQMAGEGNAVVVQDRLLISTSVVCHYAACFIISDLARFRYPASSKSGCATARFYSQ